MKNDDYWFAWRPIRFKRKTQHLGLAEDAAYRRMIDEYMLTREGLPDNDAAIARIIGVSIDKWLSVSSAVRPYFEVSNGRLINNGCEEELNTQRIHDVQRSERGKAAINARWDKHRELKKKIPDVYAENTLGIRKHTTQHNITSSSLGESGSLARSLSGAQRSPVGKTPASPELKHLVSKWTGGRDK